MPAASPDLDFVAALFRSSLRKQNARRVEDKQEQQAKSHRGFLLRFPVIASSTTSCAALVKL